MIKICLIAISIFSILNISNNVFAGDGIVKNKTVTYLLDGRNEKQTLIINSKRNHQIEFTLVQVLPCKRKLAGIAKSKGGDYEIDEDDEGTAYPAEEFIYKGINGYTLWIRIDAEDFDKARLKEIKDKNSCSFSSNLMLRK